MSFHFGLREREEGPRLARGEERRRTSRSFTLVPRAPGPLVLNHPERSLKKMGEAPSLVR